jgi:hypothetical protein
VRLGVADGSGGIGVSAGAKETPFCLCSFSCKTNSELGPFQLLLIFYLPMHSIERIKLDRKIAMRLSDVRLIAFS